ncbi:50S ribosomal protein L10 [Chloroflexota bacterium]
MSREKKVKIIDSLQTNFSQCNIGILTDYRGLSTHELTVIRRKLGESGIDYKIVKNTLARFAAKREEMVGLMNYFKGPVAIAFGYGDITEPARILSEYIRNSKVSLEIRGGFMGTSLLAVKDVATLAILPSREILLAKIVGGLQSPIVSLLNCLTSPMRGLIGVLQARIKQMEEE